MKIAIVGSRDYPDLDRVRDFVQTLPHDTVIVSGGARGPDQTAVDEARKRGLGWLVHFPVWNAGGVYDPTAGFKRNALIIGDAERVYAFWDGQSRGTRNSMDLGLSQGKLVIVYEPGKMPYRYVG